MPDARRVSQRRIVVRGLDARCAGTYRQAGASHHSPAYDAMVALMPSEWRIECSGRVSQRRSFDYAQLVELARWDHHLGFGISLIDVLAEIGLQATAEVLLARDIAGRTFGVPIRDIVGDENARLTLGTRLAPLELGRGFPVRLDVPGWTDAVDPVAVSSLEAVHFSEFVRCR